MRATSVSVLILLIFIAAGYFLFRKEAVSPSQLPDARESQGTDLIQDGDSVEWLGVFHDSRIQNGAKSFDSTEFGISFTYPVDYLLFQNDDGRPEVQNIIIGSEAAFVQSITQGVPGETPPSLYVAFYHEPTLAVSNIDHEDYLMRWMEEHTESSNFHPGDPTNARASTIIAGVPAFRYHSSIGLYDSNEYAVFVHKEWVVVVSVHDARNENRKEIFETLLASILLR